MEFELIEDNKRIIILINRDEINSKWIKEIKNEELEVRN